jgi:hypothetical protein
MPGPESIEECAMILVKAAAGLVIEFGVGPSGQWDMLSLRLSEGIASQPLRFEVSQGSTGRLLVRPLDARPPLEMVVALGLLAAHESNILAEVQKYRHARG